MAETVMDVQTQVRGQVGFITLNRPRALNALNLEMVRTLMATLQDWHNDASVLAVAIRGCNKEGPFGAFCAGGDIRFLHQAGNQGYRFHGRHRHGRRHGHQPGCCSAHRH